MGLGSVVEVELSKLLNLATRWNAVVLLDEADVFMQQRTLDNLERNGLVSGQFDLTFFSADGNT